LPLRKTVTLMEIQVSTLRKRSSIVNWGRLDDNNTLGGGQKPPKERLCERGRELGVTLRQTRHWGLYRSVVKVKRKKAC